MLRFLKDILYNSGVLQHLPYAVNLVVMLSQPKKRHWKQMHVSCKTPSFSDRTHWWEFVAERYVGQPVRYVEFGVFKGNSITKFAKLLPHEDSRFFGFDSFEGLPTSWQNKWDVYPKGFFSTEGVPPVVEDTRISFVKGWFNKTLPNFLQLNGRTDSSLIVYLDANLYTSDIFVLSSLNPYMPKGTVIFFDDFGAVLDDFRALEDFSEAFGRTYEVLATAENEKRVAIALTN